MDNTTLEEVLTRYYEAIGPHHHKDKDCWFEIVHKFGYGQDKGWHVVHRGYINSMEEGPYETYEEAAEAMKDFVIRITEEVEEWPDWNFVSL